VNVSRNLFKFVAVRPIQKFRRDREVYRFLRLPNHPEPGTQFQRAVYEADSQQDARELAERLILSDRYIRGFTGGDQTLEYLSRVHRTATGDGQLLDGEELRRELQGLIDVSRARITPRALSDLRHRLWDSLIAAFLAPRVAPHDRAELIYGLRTIALIENNAGLESREDVRDILTATPLIPQWVIRTPTAPPPAPLPKPEPVPERVPEINKLREDLQSIRNALHEIDAAQLAVSRELGSGPVAESHEGGLSEAGPRRIRTGTSRRESPWYTAEKITERVSPGTKELLESADPTWRLKRDSNLTDGLLSRQADLHQQLVRLGGRTAVSQLDTKLELKPGDFPPGVLVPIPDANTNGRFLHSIEGSVGKVRPSGWGDLLVTVDRLLRYEETEAASIENVMKTESKERIHRRLDREVERVTTENETTEETERDLQTSNRYELQSEVERTLESETTLSTGVNVSGSYGVVKVDASAEFAVNNSSSEASTSSTAYAQEVIDKSVSRVSQTLKERITKTTISEVEETNTHGFDNTSGDGHVIGVYRWVDQVWEAQVWNYGKRWMIEFIVPEPAAFFRYAEQGLIEQGLTQTAPEPLDEDFSFLDVTPGTYHTWVDLYHVPDVAPPPPKYRYLAQSVELPETIHPKEEDDYVLMTKSSSLNIPEGYVANEAWVYGTWMEWNTSGWTKVLHVYAGKSFFDVDNLSDSDHKAMNNEEGMMPITVFAVDIGSAAIVVEVKCLRTPEHLEEWQLATYQKIVDAYNNLRSAYDAHVESVKNLKAGLLNDQPPDKKRQIERTELKKASLVLLTDQHFVDFDATVENAVPHGYPEIDPAEALKEGSYIQFFELSFEWEQMTYIFYPYFWGRKEKWVENSSLTDTDTLFEAFLNAGAARVVVPVRPGYEKALAYYLKFGETWNGGDAPVLDDELFVSIVDEIADSQGVTLENAVEYGDPWTYTLPTELVILQENSALPSWEDESGT
jgi:hypothetical protein